MRKRKSRYNINGMILCALVFFAIAGTAVCMVANGKEAAAERAKTEAEKKEQEEKGLRRRQQRKPRKRLRRKERRIHLFSRVYRSGHRSRVRKKRSFI